MKILLVGEYSRLHNSLKEGLVALGHEVLLISSGDFFKKYPSDILIQRKFDSGILKKIKSGIYRFTGINITTLSVKKQFFKHKKQLQGFDVVQLINESPFTIDPYAEKEIITYLAKHNKKLFLLSCGTDYISVAFALQQKLPYSIFQGYHNNSVPKEKYRAALKYINPAFKHLHQFVYSQIEGVIASDMDYHLPLTSHPKYLGLIPNPVNTSKIQKQTIKVDASNKVIIFLGINRTNYHTKGIVYFEEALKVIEQKYSDKITIDIVENLPYAEYIERFNKAHIVLDQALAYDQGYNALEAMAKGKVVFTGASKEFEQFYNLKEKVAIHTTPNAKKIVANLEQLILNPDEIVKIGNNAAAFIEEKHHYIEVATKYVSVYKNES